MTPKTLCLASALLCSLLATAPAGAQTTYRCQVNGAVVFRDKPCDVDARPLPAPMIRTGVTERPEHWLYLNRVCRQRAELLQRLRQTASSGEEVESAAEALAMEQQRYEIACGEDDDRARRRVVDDARSEAERERAQRKLEDDQRDRCIEARRVRDLRRARLAGMNPGERADFERFEAAFALRCTGVLPPR